MSPRMITRLSLSKLEKGESDELLLFKECLSKHGVFYLNIDGAFPLENQTELLKWCSCFFSLSALAKDELSISKSKNYRGYVGIGGEYTSGTPDLKESYEFGIEEVPKLNQMEKPFHQFFGENIFPDENLIPGFADALGVYHVKMGYINKALIEVLLKVMDTGEEKKYHRLLSGDLPFFFSRLINYSRPSDYPVEEMRLEAHKDEGLFSMIIENSQGLQVQNEAGDWFVLKPPPGSIIILVSQLLEYLSNGVFQACMHRVSNELGDEGRMSVVFSSFPDLQNEMHQFSQAMLDKIACSNYKCERRLKNNIWMTDDEPSRQLFVLGDKLWERAETMFPGSN